ncbi:hypothetical protein, partial [uncultured Nitrosomonas sp.]|uniref:hypothetical protein n=1 Tax=uncultured Nitrosomonas sp. TaxID=156424 RepID=UPI002615B453
PEIFHQLAMLQYESDALLMMTSLLLVKNLKIAISYQGVNVVALEAYGRSAGAGGNEGGAEKENQPAWQVRSADHR